MLDYAAISQRENELYHESVQADRSGDIETFVRLRGKWIVYNNLCMTYSPDSSLDEVARYLRGKIPAAERELAAARSAHDEVDIWLWESQLEALKELLSQTSKPDA